MDWNKIGETFLGQLGALAAFFAYPAIQYVLLRKLSRNDGKPELWYLPKYGFRLVIRNLPKRHTLSSIHYRSLVRTIVPASDGASVATFDDDLLLQREDFFLFAGTDQVLIAFQLQADGDGRLGLVYTDKLGKPIRTVEITDRTRVISDFSATIENWFNFDVAIARRVEITGQRLREIAKEVSQSNTEQEFEVSRIRDVG